ncbi:cell wall-binding repeat-containing protein [Agromyces albus]|uniref:cell wall-binding repeat-containing protein n=1 Tax=Agromyces albus TaxID=205332 RepID=UPI001F5189C4|nr:cell wall-binding repeat-containing protein [Agromyces albus]
MLIPAPAAAIEPNQQVAASELLADLATAIPIVSGYNRDLFEHWIDADGDGCDSRQEVLIQESRVEVVFGAGCTIVSGDWLSWYDGASWTDPSDVDIDHLVALSEAWASGANAWTPEQRRSFANDLDYDISLEAVTDNVNSSKSDRDPAAWLPPLPEVRCRYATNWVMAKHRWNLAVDAEERAALSSILTGPCGSAVVTTPAKGGTASVGRSTTRISGTDRYDMAVNVAKQYAPNVPVVYIAKGTDFPDALSAAPAAAAQGGPVLLTPPDALPAVVGGELARLQPQRIVVVGGRASITDAVFAELQTYSGDVVRLDGIDRYAASRAVVNYAFGASGASRVYLTTGAKFPDALSASPAAATRDGAVLLVNGAAPTLDVPTTALIQGLHPHDAVIAGGPASVSVGIESSLTNLGLPGGSFRLAGTDRYDAARNINNETFADADIVFLATGLNFPDALAGAALAGRLSSPLYIVPGNCVPQPILGDINAMAPSQIVLLGGPNSIAPAVESLTPCDITPTASVQHSCGSGLSVSMSNPNSYAITVELRFNGSAQTSFTVQPNSSYTNSGWSLAEDATTTVSLALHGNVFYSTGIAVNCHSTPPPGPPANPGNTMNCSDFATWSAAQNWFNYYYPHYGDVALLDADNDLIACESLPGAP